MSLRTFQYGATEAKIPFDITMAMKHPDCNVDFRIEGSYYRVELPERWHLYTIFKLGCNHLNWHNQTEIKQSEYLPRALSEQSPTVTIREEEDENSFPSPCS